MTLFKHVVQLHTATKYLESIVSKKDSSMILGKIPHHSIFQ